MDDADKPRKHEPMQIEKNFNTWRMTMCVETGLPEDTDPEELVKAFMKKNDLPAEEFDHLMATLDEPVVEMSDDHQEYVSKKTQQVANKLIKGLRNGKNLDHDKLNPDE